MVKEPQSDNENLKWLSQWFKDRRKFYKHHQTMLTASELPNSLEYNTEHWHLKYFLKESI